MSVRLASSLGLAALVSLPALAGTVDDPTLRQVRVDAAHTVGTIRPLQGVDGLPMGADAGGLQVHAGPDLRGRWKDAHVDSVRTYIWHARLDTVDNPGSLFPHWAADVEDPASYNFVATDAAVRASRDVGAEILFTVASAIPYNKKPPADLPKYAAVLTHIVKHYCRGWANGFDSAIKYWEIGDEPDLNTFHFAGTPEQFYAMYAAAAAAIKSVNPALQVGGPGLAFPLNEQAPYREGLLKMVKEKGLPLDFYSWKWYSDATQDPFDINRVNAVVSAKLAAAGLAGTPQFITNWNFNAIPIARPDRLQMGVYESAALTYMQDSNIAKAFIFRGDAGMGTDKDPDPDLTTRMFERDGRPMPNGYGFLAAGRMRETPERLAVLAGADDKGFAVLAGRTGSGNKLQVLITNYAIPAQYLEPTTRTSLDFELPVPGARVPVSMQLPPRRTEAHQTNNGGYRLTIEHLPPALRHYQVSRYRLDAHHLLSLLDSQGGSGTRLETSSALPPPSIELVVIEARPET
jgi:xylan 1,4-beta-xylosidase